MFKNIFFFILIWMDFLFKEHISFSIILKVCLKDIVVLNLAFLIRIHTYVKQCICRAALMLQILHAHLIPNDVAVAYSASLHNKTSFLYVVILFCYTYRHQEMVIVACTTCMLIHSNISSERSFIILK